jgi:hypothetical protein
MKGFPTRSRPTDGCGTLSNTGEHTKAKRRRQPAWRSADRHLAAVIQAPAAKSTPSGSRTA